MPCTIVCDQTYLHTIHVPSDSTLHHTFIVISDKAPTACQIITHLDHPRSKAIIDMVALVHNDQQVSIDGQIIIGQWGVQSSWHLQEEVVIVWDHAYTSTKPILDVGNHQVSASHSAKIHKINPQQIFYLMSRWLDQKQAQRVLLEWLITALIDNQSTIEYVGSLTPLKDSQSILDQLVGIVQQ